MKIGLGTAAIGRPQYINIREKNPTAPFATEVFATEGKATLTEAYEQGVRHFDTAPGYGMAERILIEWINEFQPTGITISSKWGYTYVANYDPAALVHEVKEHSLQKLNEQWEVSKQLLPFLNIYQIHSATIESGVLTNQKVLDRLFEIKQEYQIKIGLTTSGANQKEIIQKALLVKVKNQYLFDSFQVTYNVFDQSFSNINQQLIKSGKQIIVKEALANGRAFPNSNYHHYHKIYELIEGLAKKYNVGVDAIAIRFCMDSISPFSVLSGASSTSQVSSNLKALSFQLTPKEIDQLKDLAVSPENYWLERKRLIWN